MPVPNQIPPDVERLLRAAVSALPAAAAALPGAEWHVVGGTVRDALMGRPLSGDLDLLVRGVSLETVAETLAAHGAVSFVGKRFGVLKFRPAGSGEEIDVAWPRTERAGMSGAYRDFEVSHEPDLPVEDDLARRDFTVNAMSWRISDGALIDPFGGREDLAAGRLRAVGEAGLRFREDLSRVLRGLRFACQLGFEIEPETWVAMRRAAPRLGETLLDGTRLVAAEVAAKEMVKALVADPPRAARLWDESGACSALLPELHRLHGVPQPPQWHSEGDVWTHTVLALAAFSRPEFRELFPGAVPSPLALVSVLFHDVGKATTAKVRDGRLTFWGHAEAGSEIVSASAERLRLGNAGIDAERLRRLVAEHMFPHLVDLAEVRKTTLARYFLDDPIHGTDLLHVYYADVAASLRPGGEPDFGHLRELLPAVRSLAAERVKAPLASGEDVMAWSGIAPGPEVGRLLAALREEQLAGRLVTPEEAREWLLDRLQAAGHRSQI